VVIAHPIEDLLDVAVDGFYSLKDQLKQLHVVA
jgi:hypothetical protein